MTKKMVLFVAVAVLLLGVCVVSPAAAYTLTVVNEPGTGVTVQVKIKCKGQDWQWMNSYEEIRPGQTDSYVSVDEWDWLGRGACYEEVIIYRLQDYRRSELNTISGIGCRHITVTIKKVGDQIQVVHN